MDGTLRAHVFTSTRTRLSVLLSGALILLLTSCSKPVADASVAAAARGRGAGSGGAVPVSTALVVEKAMAVNVQAVGNVEASSTVDVRSQVMGELTSVAFNEGQDVAAGQVLFTIDPRSFEAALRQAEAALARDTAQAKNAEGQRARYADLLKGGLMSRADYDTQAASAAALLAATAVDAAQVETAALQLQFTRIKAPVSGRTGALLVHPGSIVRASDTSPLVVVNQMSPVFVSFAVPARLLPRVRTDQARAALTVRAATSGGLDAPSEGTVSFIDNAVDPATDTIRLKATFENRGHRLWPGAFVDVTLRLSVEAHAIVVPDAAVQAGQQGHYVYVVTADRTVEVRPVTVAWTEGVEAVIRDGVRPGETVVIDGQSRLTPGAPVSIKGGPGNPAPSS
jgi:multidrug efflux system membrane fusion protein